MLVTQYLNGVIFYLNRNMNSRQQTAAYLKYPREKAQGLQSIFHAQGQISCSVHSRVEHEKSFITKGPLKITF